MHVVSSVERIALSRLGLGPAVLERLEAYADCFRPHFNRTRQALWAEVYLRGLIQEGERKSIKPLSRRALAHR